MSDDKVIPVRVILRCRPLITKEIVEGCQICLEFVPNEPQVIIGRDKAFTYDFAFSPETKQEEVYDKGVSSQISQLFKGYNVTILAYGQTGSGKTFTMGTAYDQSVKDDSGKGIIQRAVEDIFCGINEREDSEFLIKVSFLEIHKEEIYDLLNKSKTKDPIAIREDYDGGIKVVGLTELPVTTPEETIQLLAQGSLSRTTASTAMNSRSSRSHAIFTIIMEQRGKGGKDDLVRAKFHLVDLAGSERPKKTGAQGERFKEGVNINRGLLALGNVISALCDESTHIPYRDSKLTRLLQDSLGGNSHTVMIACVSPADSNFDETLNTLRYSDRARKIKNKPIVNRDPHTAELSNLRQMVKQLQVQLLQSQTICNSNSGGSDGLQSSGNVKILLERNQHLEDENKRLGRELQAALDQTTHLCEKALLAEMSRDRLLRKLEELKEKTGHTVDAMNQSLDVDKIPQLKEQLGLVTELQEKLIELQADQIKRDKEFTLYSPSKQTVKRSSKKMEADNPEPIDNGLSPSKDSEDDENTDFHLQSTLRQAALSRELQKLEETLALKQDLANRMEKNDGEMAIMRIQFENNLRQMEEEISNLQKEKEELSSALRAVQNNCNTNKLNEQRRKRLQELESQIVHLKKEMNEKSRMIKLKEEAEKKVKTLQHEIQSMKQSRVSLLKKMREESDKYKKWKQEKDKEVAQLRQKERKRQFEIVKMEQRYTKQQTVLRRKMEEAMAANKRLNDALHQQRTVAERRTREKEQSMHCVGSRVKQWLSQELEVVVSSKEAEYHLQNLLDDRKTISEQLNQIKCELDNTEPPSKKVICENNGVQDSDSSSYDEKEALQEQVHSLQHELKLRNAQITDLQQKIMDVDQDQASKQRWESLQSMVEAKCALKWLFDTAASFKMESFLQTMSSKITNDTFESKIEEYKKKYDEAMSSVEDAKNEIQEMKILQEEKLTSLVREYEDKTLYLLKQMQISYNANIENNSTELDSTLLERIKFQEMEISQLSHLHEDLLKKNSECEQLKKEVALLKYKNGNKSFLPCLTEDPPEQHEKKTSKQVKSKTSDIIYLSEDSLEESFSNDENDDPEWRLTPMYKRRLARTKRSTAIATDSKDSIESEDGDKKLNKKIGGKCGCQGNCRNKICSCRKVNKTCTDNCKCSENKCQNRDPESDSQSSLEGGSDIMNTTFHLESKTSDQSTNVADDSVFKLPVSKKGPKNFKKHKLFANNSFFDALV